MRNRVQERIRQEKVFRAKRRTKRIAKKHNIRKCLRRRHKKLSLAKSSYSNRFRSTVTKIQLPYDFRLLGNTEVVLKTISDFESTTRRISNIRHKFYLNLSTVQCFDVAALDMLLAVINSIKDIPVLGNYPRNRTCRDFFIESGFLDHMNSIQGKKPEKKNKNNMMIERGFDKTSNKRIGEEVRHAVKHLTGEDNSYRPVFSIIQEMCANSIEHANKKVYDKNWLVGIFYEKEKVIFTVIDIGQGILSTLKKKAGQKLRDAIIAKGDVGTLIGAFDKKYQSSTFDENRNKGLPRIKNTNKSNYIDSLKVITNNVLLDFSDGNNNTLLKNRFRGTFYYWELTKNTIEQWRNRNTI